MIMKALIVALILRGGRPCECSRAADAGSGGALYLGGMFELSAGGRPPRAAAPGAAGCVRGHRPARTARGLLGSARLEGSVCRQGVHGSSAGVRARAQNRGRLHAADGRGRTRRIRRQRSLRSEKGHCRRCGSPTSAASRHRPGTGATVRVVVDLPAAPKDAEKIDVVAALTEDDLTSSVRRGENSGRTLQHAAVVRLLQTLGELGPEAEVAEGQLALDRGVESGSHAGGGLAPGRQDTPRLRCGVREHRRYGDQIARPNGSTKKANAPARRFESSSARATMWRAFSPRHHLARHPSKRPDDSSTTLPPASPTQIDAAYIPAARFRHPHQGVHRFRVHARGSRAGRRRARRRAARRSEHAPARGGGPRRTAAPAQVP